MIDGDESRVFGPDEGLPISGVVCFAEDQDHVIWLSNTAGVYRVLDDRVVELLDTSGDPIRAVACLKAGDDGTMWMGSLTAGLLRWPRRRARHNRAGQRAANPRRAGDTRR